MSNVRPENMERITNAELANAFIEEQVEALRKQIGDKKVLLALSGGVDSSVVAALLIKAVGDQNLNRLFRSSEIRCQPILSMLTLLTVSLTSWQVLTILSRRGRSSVLNSSECLKKKPESWTELNSWHREPFTLISWKAVR